jgi:hypothetical protein
MEPKDIWAATRHYCPLISALVIEALGKGVEVDELSRAIAFPFGEEDWPGMEDGSYAGVEIARSAISYILYDIQFAMLEQEELEAKKKETKKKKKKKGSE